jgi:hypothetical protein
MLPKEFTDQPLHTITNHSFPDAFGDRHAEPRTGSRRGKNVEDESRRYELLTVTEDVLELMRVAQAL